MVQNENACRRINQPCRTVTRYLDSLSNDVRFHLRQQYNNNLTVSNVLPQRTIINETQHRLTTRVEFRANEADRFVRSNLQSLHDMTTSNLYRQQYKKKDEEQKKRHREHQKQSYLRQKLAQRNGGHNDDDGSDGSDSSADDMPEDDDDDDDDDDYDVQICTQSKDVMKNMQATVEIRKKIAENLKNKKFFPMGQEWDVDKPCEHCKCIWLKANDNIARRGCCKEGAWACLNNDDNSNREENEEEEYERNDDHLYAQELEHSYAQEQEEQGIYDHLYAQEQEDYQGNDEEYVSSDDVNEYESNSDEVNLGFIGYDVTQKYSAGGFPLLHPYPSNLKTIVTNDGVQFNRLSSYYNNLFSIGITGVDNGKEGVGYDVMNMDSCVKLSGGRIYHRIPNNLLSSCGIANIVYDSYNDHLNDTVNKNGISVKSANIIRKVLKNCNPYIRGLLNCDAFLSDSHNISTHSTAINLETREDEIGILRQQNQISPPMYYITIPGDATNEQGFIHSDSSQVEPLLYPLLFPYGEEGWGKDLKRQHNITLLEYLKARLLQPEENFYINSIRGDKIHVNRFQAMSRLSQYYMIEGFSRSIDKQLSYQQQNQNYMLGRHDEDSDVSEEDANGNTVRKKKKFLSDSVHGSARHRKKKAANALAICSECGPPHCFTTMTVNPYCQEIQEMLLPGQTAYQRPDIVARVFAEKKRALIHNIKNGRYFGGLKCKYIMYVIEYQFRGLPHVHIVYRLDGGPDHKNKEECIKFIETYIQSSMPQIPTRPEKPESSSSSSSSSSSTECDKEETYKKAMETYLEDLRYYNIVKNLHIHTCSDGINGCLKNGICNKHFEPRVVNETNFDERGYPVYKRMSADDYYVVTHVKQMLLDDPDGCHINTAFCGSNYCIVYLYKYLYKGK